MATQRETMALNGVPGSVLGASSLRSSSPSTGAQTPRVAPDPEVVAKPTRRQFSRPESCASLAATMCPPLA